MQLAQLKDLLDAVPAYMTSLDLTYLPYGRQDKEVSNTTTFGLHSFARLLNSLGFDEVRCRDPHSWIAGKLIKNFRPYYPVEELNKTLRAVDSNLICYPDEGASSKYLSIYEWSAIQGRKERDQLTGQITKYELDDEDVKDKRVLIVDDICDGGATFVLIADALYNSGAEEVNLFVSHGIFSKGLRPLLDAGIKRIFTPDGEIFPDRAITNGFTYRRL